MVFNRLTEPRSKLGLLEWFDTVVMPDCQAPSHQQLLRAMDVLIDHIDAVEAAVCAQVRPLLDQSVSIIFYDLTTIRYCGKGVACDDWQLINTGLSKEGGIGKQFVLGVVQSADGLPLLHTVAPGNVGETTTLIAMLEHACKRFSMHQMVVVADRRLLSLENLSELEMLAKAQNRAIDFILAVPARRYKELNNVVRNLVFEDGLAEAQFTNHRLVVAFDPQRGKAQSQARRERMHAVEQLAEKMSQKLDAQDTGKLSPGQRASDRGAYARFSKELKDRQLSRLYNIDWKADLFSYSPNESALADAELMDGKLLLITSLKAKAFSAAEIVQRYKALADIERGFRCRETSGNIVILPVTTGHCNDSMARTRSEIPL
jgi:transposase